MPKSEQSSSSRIGIRSAISIFVPRWTAPLPRSAASIRHVCEKQHAGIARKGAGTALVHGQRVAAQRDRAAGNPGQVGGRLVATTADVESGAAAGEIDRAAACHLARLRIAVKPGASSLRTSSIPIWRSVNIGLGFMQTAAAISGETPRSGRWVQRKRTDRGWFGDGLLASLTHLSTRRRLTSPIRGEVGLR